MREDPLEVMEPPDRISGGDNGGEGAVRGACMQSQLCLNCALESALVAALDGAHRAGVRVDTAAAQPGGMFRAAWFRGRSWGLADQVRGYWAGLRSRGVRSGDLWFGSDRVAAGSVALRGPRETRTDRGESVVEQNSARGEA